MNLPIILLVGAGLHMLGHVTLMVKNGVPLTRLNALLYALSMWGAVLMGLTMGGK